MIKGQKMRRWDKMTLQAVRRGDEDRKEEKIEPGKRGQEERGEDKPSIYRHEKGR